MNIALAGVQADFTQFDWMYNKKHAFKLKLDEDLPLTVEKDDLIGLRRTTKGPTAGSYQVVLAKYPQKIFRSVPQAKIDKFLDNMGVYEGVPEKPAKTGQRQAQLVRKQVKNTDKTESQYYVCPNSPRELTHYDRDDYQWRKVVRTLPIVTKVSSSHKATLQAHDIIGVRYLRKSHGGFIILPSGERVHIAHDTYEKIVENTDIEPRAKQQKGIVDIKELMATIPKRTRVKMPPKPVKIPKVAERKEDSAAFIDRSKALVSDYDYADLEEEMDFDEDEEDDLLNPPHEFDEEDTVNSDSGNPLTPLEDEDFDDEDDPEMDFHKDHDIDEETGEEMPPVNAIYAEEGVVLRSRDNKEWVVVSVDNHGMSDILAMFNEQDGTMRHYTLPAGEDLRNMKSVAYVRTLDSAELEEAMEKSAGLEMSAGKRL